jgi:hypothetical protein
MAEGKPVEPDLLLGESKRRFFEDERVSKMIFKYHMIPNDF